MKIASQVALRGFLMQCSSKKKEQLTHFIPSDLLNPLLNLPPSSFTPRTPRPSLQERVAHIHYSWLSPFFETYPDHDKSLLVSALDKRQMKKLLSYFKLPFPPVELGKHAALYMLQTLHDWVVQGDPDYSPIELLLTHPLNPLLSLSKAELVSLIDFLGLRDVAIDMKQTIQSDALKKLATCLSKERQAYLKTLMTQKLPVKFSSFGLAHWKGDEIELTHAIHQRGLNRLAKALYGNPGLLWHVAHQLDQGRAKILKKFSTDVKNKKAHDLLVKEVEELIAMIQKGHV